LSRTVGLISDTHGLLREEALAALRDSDFIIHAGDIGDPGILASLSALAPLSVVRGNIDTDAWASGLPTTATLEVDGILVFVVHDVADLDPAAAMGCRVVVSGHSHRPGIRDCDGVLFVNPSSAGRRRFSLPVSIGRLRITGGEVTAGLVELKLPPAPPGIPRRTGATRLSPR